MFRKAEGKHARAFQADGRAINEKVRLYARIGTALIAAHDSKQDAFDAIATVIPWDRVRTTVAEAEALARSEEFDAYQMLGEHYAGTDAGHPRSSTHSPSRACQPQRHSCVPSTCCAA